MRQIVLDTETTGIGHEQGHRIIEIGCVEIIDRRLTNNHYHVYINPERPVDEGAFKVHGISNEFLEDKPLFNEVLKEFLNFVADAELIIHNAPFDVGFLNAELKLARQSKTIEDYCKIFDTLPFARQRHPGQRNSLDALCKRYDIDNSNRQLHGALLDAEILAHLYLAMTGGQKSLFADEHEDSRKNQATEKNTQYADIICLPVIHADEKELSAHQKLIDLVKTKSGIDHWSEE